MMVQRTGYPNSEDPVRVDLEPGFEVCKLEALLQNLLLSCENAEAEDIPLDLWLRTASGAHAEVALKHCRDEPHVLCYLRAAANHEMLWHCSMSLSSVTRPP